MKRVMTIVLALFIASWGINARAAVSDNEKLEKESQSIEKTAAKPEGKTAVIQRLEKQFNVTDSQISALRNQKLGFGEITIVFALAEKMQGGITTDNVNKILALRQGPPVQGWGEVAKKMDLKLGPVISSVEKAEHASHTAMIKEERHERRQSEERMEKQDRTGGSEHGMGGGRR